MKVKVFALLKKYDYAWLVLGISALAYLPHLNQFGYFRDDWYLMYAANALGKNVFQQIYAIDRPLRALVMSGAYELFGVESALL
ncbi:MAG: hypothetical protein LC108_07310 [Anaerolineales bacterium]|nr:hypothetical protein [Anaerolineales bacterium]